MIIMEQQNDFDSLTQNHSVILIPERFTESESHYDSDSVNQNHVAAL
jgi:hypothetical protein